MVLTHLLRIIRRIHSRPIEQEAATGESLALPLTESIHQLLQLRGTLDLEEDLIVVVGHLDVEVLGLLLRFVVCGAFLAWGLGAGVDHCVLEVGDGLIGVWGC